MSIPTTPRSRQVIAFSDDDLVELEREGAVEAEDQARLDRVLEARPVHAPRRRGDDVVEVLLAAAVPLHRVEAELHRRHVVLAVGAADDLVDGALDGDRRALDQLRPVEELEVAVEAAGPRRRHRDRVAELPVVAGRELDALGVGDAPHDRRRHRAAEMAVELGERDLAGELAGHRPQDTGVARPAFRRSGVAAARRSPPTSSGELAAGRRGERRRAAGPSRRSPISKRWRRSGDLPTDGLDLLLAEVRPAGVQPLVARQQLRPVAGEVLEEVLAGPRPEVEDVRPDRGRAGVAGGLHDVARAAPAGPTGRAGSGPSRRRRRSRRRRACAAPAAAGVGGAVPGSVVRQIASSSVGTENVT